MMGRAKRPSFKPLVNSGTSAVNGETLVTGARAASTTLPQAS